MENKDNIVLENLKYENKVLLNIINNLKNNNQNIKEEIIIVWEGTKPNKGELKEINNMKEQINKMNIILIISNKN